MIQKLEDNVHSVKSVVQLGPFPDAKKVVPLNTIYSAHTGRRLLEWVPVGPGGWVSESPGLSCCDAASLNIASHREGLGCTHASAQRHLST